MKLVRVMFITVVLGLAVGILPKTSSAHDVSVGFAFGIPFPVIEVHHALPSPPPPPWAFYNHPRYHRNACAYEPRFRNYRDNEYRDKGHGNYKREERRHRRNRYND
ncbi:MAG: hypothetical protein FP814_06960 [Desulfobacterium sp.]|nr:hypothetical protein [Desulfobacterium sp.]MBU3947615.1 hypothetical protein [Pseudomonadota bacterium]MBU4035661.1 hypothetical protein [Pseudomonadota bacterium]